MIRYDLICADGYQFEGWFSSSADYEAQAKAGQLCCGICGTASVEKAIMAPMVARTDRGASEIAAAVRAHIKSNCDYVGDEFAKVARDIHDGVEPERAIWGEASPREARELREEGVGAVSIPDAFAPVPDKRLN